MSVLELNGRVFDASTTGTLTLTSEGGATTTDVTQGLDKSWVNWNCTGTAAVRDSFNHSSLTDNGTGDFTLTVSSAMTNGDYCRSGMAGHAANSQQVVSQAEANTVATATQGRYVIAYANHNLEDSAYAGVVLHGDLA